MHRKPYRFGLLIIGLLVTTAAGYRAVEDEASLGRASREGVAHDRAAGQALEALLDLRASLHAYVAPGQGVPFWSARAEKTIDALRGHLVMLDTALARQRGSLAETLDTVDQLAAAERRMREYASRDEALLAGDVVFTEVRDLVASAIAQVQAARNTLAAVRDSNIAALRREQALLAAAAMAAWLVIALLLVPPVKEVAVKDPNEWRNDLAATIRKPIPKDPEPAPMRTKPAEPSELSELSELSEASHPRPQVVPALSLQALQHVSEVCSDLSTLSDVGALSGALSRAANALEASGVIVWIASNDGNSLSPVSSHGFDEKLVSRIGRIPRDSANLTAAAFRDNIPRISAATDTAPAALAVALCGPTGPVGVLSVELKPGIPADDARVALATIFAAQLATLAHPIPAPQAPEAPDAPYAPYAPQASQASVSARGESSELRRDPSEAAPGREGGSQASNFDVPSVPDRIAL